MNSCGIFLVVFVACVAAVAEDTKKFRNDYKYSTNAEGWLKFHKELVDWETARLTCQHEGAILASPINENLIKSMKVLMEREILKNNSVFTGINGLYSFEGVPRSKITNERADKEQDDYNDEENCMSMGTDGKLADVNCNGTLPFICYKKSTKNLVSISSPSHTNMTRCGTTDHEYSLEHQTGSCYKFHRNPRSWPMARKACTDEGGQLAIINHDIEAQVIMEIFAKYPPNTKLLNDWQDKAFIGFRGWTNNADLFTVDGQTLEEAGYAKFMAGQPMSPAENAAYCGAVTRNGLLTILQCDHIAPFICEKSLLREQLQ